MARQLFSLGGVSTLSDDNLRSLGLGILGAPLTDLAPTGVLGLGPMVAEDINRPTSGYETKEKKEEIDKAYEKYEKEGLFKDLGISPEDLRSQQMKEIEGQTAGLGLFGPISKGLQSIFGPKVGQFMFANYVKAPTINRGIKGADRARREIARAIARAETARQQQALASSQDWTGASSDYRGGDDTPQGIATGNYHDPYDPGHAD